MSKKKSDFKKRAGELPAKDKPIWDVSLSWGEAIYVSKADFDRLVKVANKHRRPRDGNGNTS